MEKLGGSGVSVLLHITGQTWDIKKRLDCSDLFITLLTQQIRKEVDSETRKTSYTDNNHDGLQVLKAPALSPPLQR